LTYLKPASVLQIGQVHQVYLYQPKRKDYYFKSYWFLNYSVISYLEEKSSSTSSGSNKQQSSLQDVDLLAKQLEDMKEQVKYTPYNL